MRFRSKPLTGAEYQRHNDAVMRRAREHFDGRSDLPGQLELPDTAPDPAALAKRKAAEPMRPSVAQKPCDHGLFNETQTQIDLEDMLG